LDFFTLVDDDALNEDNKNQPDDDDDEETTNQLMPKPSTFPHSKCMLCLLVMVLE